MSFYYKTNWSTTSNKPLIKVYIHQGNWYDHANGAVNASSSGSSSNIGHSNLIACCQTTFNPSTSWTRFVDNFDQYQNHSENTDNDYSTLVRPQYILASFSTNETAGGGTVNDKLYLDELFCIYDKGLSSLTIGGTANNDAISYFNAQEFLTHEPIRTYSTTDGSPTALFNSGTATYNYPTPIACNNIPQVAAQPKSKLISEFTVTQASADNGYKATIHVKHNDNSTFDYYIQFSVDIPTLTATPTPESVCAGESATITVSGADTYSWSTGQTGSSITVTPAQQTTYTVSGTGSNGCVGTTTVIVGVNPLPNVTITGNTSICSGASTTLTGTGAASYAWSNGITGNPITVSTGGNYAVTGTSSFGCTATASVTVTEHDAPTVAITGPTSLCSGTTATLTASGLSNYTWSGPATGENATLEISAGGNYTVSGTDANGCSGTALYTVTGKTTPTVTISSTPVAINNGVIALCDGSSTTLTATANPTTNNISWSNGSTGATLNVNSVGTYTATANLDGCESSASVTVNVASTPAAPTATNGSRCGTGTVELAVANPNPDLTYYWYLTQNAGTEAGTGTTFTTPSISNTTNYFVSAKNAGGCYSTRTQVTATVNTAPTVTVATVSPICSGANATLTASGATTYSWDNDLGTGNNITVTLTATTTYNVIGTDDNGCTGTASVTITVNDLPAAPTVTTTPTSPICSNNNVSVQFNATAPAGHTVRWYESNQQNPSQGSQITRSLGVGTTTINATIFNNSTQCESAMTPVEVVINPLPASPTVSNTSICGEGDVTLTATTSNTLKWYSDQEGTNEVSANQHVSATTTFYAAAIDGNGCVSATAPMTVTVNPNYPNIDIYQTACGSYTWQGETYTTSGDYIKPLTSSQGCDSTVTLHLTINNGYTVNIDSTVCNQLVWQGGTYTTSQIITKTLTSQSECDSVVTINLTVKQSTTSSQTLTLCSNQLPYMYGTTEITSAGTKTITLTNADGCDSIITLTVIVNTQPGLPTNSSTTLSRCGEGTLTLSVSKGSNSDGCNWYTTETGGEPISTGLTYQPNVTESTTFYVSSFTNAGCESERIAVDVTVNPVPANPQITTADDTRCGAGDIILSAAVGENGTQCRWYGNNNPNTTTVLSTENTYTVTFNSNTNATRTFYVESYNETTGCKSATRVAAVATENTVPAAPQVTAATNCGPLTADLADYVTTSADLYRWYDSEETQLAENAHYNTTVNETTSYLVSIYNGETTCESPKTILTVTIYPTYEAQSIYDTVCQNAHYQNHGIDQTFTTAGEQSFVLNTVTANGCDSLVTLYIYVKPTVTNTISFEACNEYTWAGETHTESGVYSHTFTAANGCDSVVTLNLTINTALSQDIYDTACNSYTWNGETYYQSGEHTMTFTSANNCDSVVTLHLTINNSNAYTDIHDTCDSFTWIDGITYTESNNTATYTLTNAAGCDSVVTLNLTIRKSTAYTDVHDVCDSYTWIDGITYTESNNTATYTLTNATGCDSVVTLNLTVRHATTATDVHDVCDSFTWIDGNTYTESNNTATYTTTNAEGCDSVITLDLTVRKSTAYTDVHDVCDSYTWIDGNTYTESNNTATFTTTNAAGCDSVITLNLTVRHATTATDVHDVCDSYTWIDGNTYTESNNTATFTTTNAEGCDSVITLDLTVRKSTAYTDVHDVCDSYTWIDGITYTESNNTATFTTTNAAGCDSVITLNLTVRKSTAYTDVQEACSSYTWIDGNTYTESNHTATVTLENTAGCDSIVTLNLTIHYPAVTELTDTVCEGTTYNRYNFQFATDVPGTYTQTQDLKTIHNCDSTVTLTLIVNPTDLVQLADTICIGEPYTENGFNLPAATQSGVFNHTLPLQNVYGCDSTVQLTLTVAPTQFIVLNDEVCAGERYTDNGFDTIFRAAGTYTLTHYGQTVFGCDSTTTLSLVVSPTYQTHLYDTICFNGSYAFGNQTLTIAGVYTDTMTSARGCDSVLILHLYVRPEKRGEIVAHICSGSDYNENGFNLSDVTETGDHERTDLDVNGCDSTTTLHLFVHESAITELTDTVCQGTPYNRYGFQFATDEAGTFSQTRTLETSFHCDSTVTLTLTVNPTHHLTYDIDGCVNEPISAYGFDTTYNRAGNYTLEHQGLNVYGCDSVTTLNVHIYSKPQTYLNAAICFNGEYDFNGQSITEAGVYTATLPSAHNCDSTVRLYLTKYPEKRREIETHTCYGVDFNDFGFNIQNPTATDDYENIDPDVHNCDSTTTLHLIVHEPAATDLEAVLCVGEVYNQNGFNIAATAPIDTIYVQNLETTFGCDSIVTLHLVVNPVHYIELTADVCAGVAYTGYGFDTTIANANTYTLTHLDQNIFGCDSTTVLHLNVHPNYNISFSTSICANTSYYFNGNMLTESGVYTANLSTIHGCDSIVTLTLNVGEEFRDTIVDHVCTDAAYNKYGFTISAPVETGFYSQHQTSQSGCDSFVVLHLYVHELNTTELYDTLCEGTPYQQYGFNIPNATTGSHSFTRTVKTAYGCDSTVVLNLVVYPVHHAEYNDDVCVNEPYSGYGFDTVITQSGIHTLTYNGQNIHGCDSTVTLHLNVHPTYHQTINAAICYDETYPFDGMDLDQSGTYTANYTTAHGCDSIITLVLTVYPESRDSLEAHICLGESYYADGFTIDSPTETDFYAQYTQLPNGCDSITILHLFVHEPAVTVLYDTLCGQSAYSGYGFTIANTVIGTTDYTRHLETSYSCDSTVTLYLTVNPVHHLVVDTTLCAGETFTKYGFDTTFAETGSYTLTHEGQNSYGCDSTFTVNISVYPVFQHEIEATICHNQTYLFNGVALAETGDYTDTLSTVHGCDSIVTLYLNVYPEKRDTLEVDLCEGESYTENNFEIFTPTETKYYSHVTADVNGCDSTTVLHLIVHPRTNTNFTQTLCIGERYNENGFDVLASVPGTFTYTQHLYTTFGCDSMVTVQITVNPTHQIVLNDTICAGNAYTLNGFDTTFTEAGLYTLTNLGQNVYGCDSTTTLNLRVWPSYHYSISKMICENGSFEFNGQTLTEAGTYTAELTTAHGCDSIVVLNLSVGAEYRDTIVAHACAGSDYTEYNFNLTNVTETGYHTQQGTAQNGCDSVTVLYLIVHELNTTELNGTLCLGESYQLNDFDVTPTTTGDTTCTRTVTTGYGCDSTIVLHLTVNPTSTVTLTDEVCAGNPYQANGFDTTFAEAGVYTLTSLSQNVYGCDSTTTMTLTVWPNLQSEYNETICYNTSYDFHGTILTESGDYNVTLQTEHGCDSVVTLHLSVNEQLTELVEATSCVSYTWNDSLYTESGDYTQNFTAVNGCDSVVTLHLTINQPVAEIVEATACVSYTWNDSVYTESGDYAQTFTAVNGCDSVVTLHLTINQPVAELVEATSCVSYTWNDSVYTESGDYTQTFTAANGCDSVVTLHLTINQPVTELIEATACGSYTWNDSVYTESGDYVQTFTNMNGCDSTVTLHLTINSADAIAINATACVNFIWNDSVYTESGDYTQQFQNVNGCDSVVTLHLTINPVHNIDLYDTICLGAHYVANGFDTMPDAAGLILMTDQQLNQYGCDSTTTLHLTIWPTADVQYSAVICLGEPFSQYGFDTLMTAAGTHTLVHEGQTIHGCDSITTLTLTVNPTYSFDTTVNICDVEVPFIWDDEQYWETGDFTISYSTVSGCDSILHLHLNVNPTYSADTAVTVCQGALPYWFDDDHSFTQGGIHTISLTTESGCDSIWTLHLTVIPNAEHYVTHTICASELPHTFMDSTFTEAGEYDIVVADLDNCLTITHFTLNVNETYHHFDTVTVCEETLPYLYGTTPLTQSGDFDIHFNTVNSCDSLVTVHFTVIPTAHGVEEMYVCTSDFPVVYNGSTFPQEGVYEVTFQRDGLCDSIVTLTLNEAPEYLFPETAEVCDHALPYLWRDMTLTESGIYYDSLTTGHGCDSVYMLTLTVNPTVVITDNPIVLCNGESETWRGMTLSESGIYRDTVNSATTGCYEIHEVTVTVNPTYHFYDTVTICSDELPYQWHGMTLTSAGEREDYNQTVNFCDSVYHLTLYVNPSYHSTETASACDYDLPYLWHGQTITVSGIYYDTLTTAAGCDSTFALTFTVNPSSYVVEADTICNTELPYLWRGYHLTAGGTYYDTLPNSFGCNDVYELQLTVNQSDAVTIYDTICQGGYYTQHGFDTLASQAGTLYSQLTLTNANGCDSIVNLILQVMPTYLFETTAATCENVPYEWHGGEYSVAGDYYDSLTTVYGCDSVYVLHLSLNPIYDVYVSDSAIREHEYIYDNFVITPADSGTFEYDIQYYTMFGCDSIVHLTLYVAFNDGVEEFTMEPEFSFYPNPTSVLLNIRGERMRSVAVFNMAGKLLRRQDADTPEFTQIDVMNLPTGHYLVKVTLDDGKTVTGKIIVSRR